MKYVFLFILAVSLSACGDSYPTLTHYKAFDERFNTVIDTKDSAKLKLVSELFFDRQEASDAEGNLDFVYLIDITQATGSERWRCTRDGYCQKRTAGDSTDEAMIYKVERYRELYQESNLN